MNSTSGPPLPGAYLERMQLLLGDAFNDFLASYTSPAKTGLRANTLKINLEHFRKIIPFDVEAVSWCAAGFVYKLGTGDSPWMPPGKHPYHAAGLYYIQEPSAMAASEILAPQPGENVLDLAAAPGGKTTHLAAQMENTGLLVANEIHPKRVWELAENLERWGVRNAIVLNESPARLADHFGSYFDRVLLDAPCSGEGMFRKHVSARSEWSPELVLGCAIRQGAILDEAARLVRPNGVLLYSTCTFAPQENEGVIANFLANHPEFGLDEIQPQPGFQSGRPEWLPDSLRNTLTAKIKSAVRLWPHTGQGEGHFIARLRRAGGEDTALQGRWRAILPTPAAWMLYQEFSQQVLGLEPDREHLALSGSYLYEFPPNLPALHGLKVIHPGLWLGVLKSGDHRRSMRFEPAHALAMAMKPGLARERISLNPELAGSYLQGNVLESSGQDGWVLIETDGFPLGWGKRVRGRVKNYYPKGLRWRL